MSKSQCTKEHHRILGLEGAAQRRLGKDTSTFWFRLPAIARRPTVGHSFVIRHSDFVIIDVLSPTYTK